MIKFKEKVPARCERTYPYFGKTREGTVVLFGAPKIGTVVSVTENSYRLDKLGSHSTDWNEDIFTVVHGTLSI